MALNGSGGASTLTLTSAKPQAVKEWWGRLSPETQNANTYVARGKLPGYETLDVEKSMDKQVSPS